MQALSVSFFHNPPHFAPPANLSLVFDWFVNISTISGYIAWIVCLITYIRFHKALRLNNMLETLPYRTPFQPYAAYIVLFVLSILTLTNGFQVFFPDNWDVAAFLAAYITIPLFLALYLGHKVEIGRAHV